jgi:hypothetical protein
MQFHAVRFFAVPAIYELQIRHRRFDSDRRLFGKALS